MVYFFGFLGGLALFLYGMQLMGEGLQRAAGEKLQKILEKLTGVLVVAVALGAVVTGILQSSSATTVMTVGFVNAGLMNLKQAFGVVMGANIGTTMTAQLIAFKLTDYITLFLAIGFAVQLLAKRRRGKYLGQVILGFGILMLGMEMMSSSVMPLREYQGFIDFIHRFSDNPLLGVLVGLVMTMVIQSSSATIGVLIAIANQGLIPLEGAIPVLLGDNIGTCITPILASIGASKNAKRTAAVHLSFNIIGTCVFLIVIYTVQSISPFSFWELPIDKGGIANFHTTFNVCVTLMFLPFVGLLEKLVIHLIPDQQTADEVDDPAIALDDRLLTSPGLAIQHCRDAVLQMGKLARKNFSASVRQLEQYNHKEAEKIREREDTIDRLEDRLGNYMLKIPQDNLSEQSSATISALLHILSEFERIGDYSINLVEFAENMESTGAEFSPQAQFELTTIGEAVGEAIDMALGCFEKQDLALAETIEPLEEVVDQMQETLKDRHINRLRNGQCTVDAAFPFVESLSCLERISDHCSNIGVYMISYVRGSDEVDHHTYIMQLHSGQVGHYNEQFRRYTEKYYDQIRSAKA